MIFWGVCVFLRVDLDIKLGQIRSKNTHTTPQALRSVSHPSHEGSDPSRVRRPENRSRAKRRGPPEKIHPMVLAVTPPDLPQGPATKLFLGGLPAGVTDEDLREHFETFGKVDESVVKQPQGMSMQSHFGFLWVRPAEAARQIIAQGHTIHCASGLSVTIPAPVLARSTRMSKTWHSLRPAGPPEAPPSVRWFRLPQNFGQPRPISRSGRAGWHRRPCFRLL